MNNRVAPMRGTTSLYVHLPNSKVLIMRDNYKHTMTSIENFNYLYYELNDTVAALKEDCIEYVIHYPHKPLSSYPDWYISAYDNALIFEESADQFIFYDERGDLAMSTGSVVLRNFMGDLKYMEMDDFKRYYDIIGG